MSSYAMATGLGIAVGAGIAIGEAALCHLLQFLRRRALRSYMKRRDAENAFSAEEDTLRG